MSADEHRAHAQAEDDEAHAHEAKYDPDAEKTLVSSDTSDVFTYSTATYNPTQSHLKEAEEHRDHAEAHRKAAAALEAFEEAECEHFPPETRSSCPLLGQISAVGDVDGGVALTPAAGVDREALVTHMRCHVAFAAVHGFEGMDACPLYVTGVSVVDAGGDIRLTAEDQKRITAIRARAATHVQ